MLLGHKQLVFSWPHTRIYHAPCYAVIHSECFCYEDWKISVSHVFSPQKVDETTKTGLVQIPHLTISENDNPSRFARKWPDILRLAETVGFRFCLFTCFYFHVNWQKEKRAVSLSFQKITFPAEFWQFVCLFVCLFCRGLFTGLVHTKTIPPPSVLVNGVLKCDVIILKTFPFELNGHAIYTAAVRTCVKFQIVNVILNESEDREDWSFIQSRHTNFSYFVSVPNFSWQALNRRV